MKFVPSAFVGVLSRSAGSTTAARNRFGSYFRNRVQPVNPMTSKQTAARSNFGSHSASWRLITEAQRTAWNEFGLNFSKTDSLGQSYTLTGLQAYISVNRMLALVGTAPTAVPPTFDIPDGLNTLTLTADTTPTLSVAYTVTPLPTGAKLEVEATRPVSPGINFQPRSAYKLIAISAAAAASPLALGAAYETVFGPMVPDMKILVRARVISADGLYSPWIEAQVIAGEP